MRDDVAAACCCTGYCTQYEGWGDGKGWEGAEAKPERRKKEQGRCGSLLLFAFSSAAEIELMVCLPFPAAVASRFVSVSLAFYSPSWGGSLLVRLAAFQLHSPPSACGSAFAHCIRYFAHAEVHMRLPSAQPNTSHAACLPRLHSTRFTSPLILQAAALSLVHPWFPLACSHRPLCLCSMLPYLAVFSSFSTPLAMARSRPKLGLCRFCVRLMC